MNVVKRLYNWVLKWADSRWGTVALFLFAFSEASFFPAPPDILLIPLCLGRPSKSFKYAFVCLAGSVLGAMAAYGLGHWAWGAVEHWFIPGVFSQASFEKVASLYDKWNFWAVFTAGFTPVPYKIFTLAGGAFHINFWMFVLASIVGRGARFFLVGGLIWRYGASIKGFIDKYFNLIATAFVLLLLSGFLLVRYL